MPRGTPYQSVVPPEPPEHPVDLIVERRLSHGALRRKARRLVHQIMNALGEKQDLYLQLEELLGEADLDRHAAYFDVGYEHGLVAGRAETRAAHQSRARRALAAHLRQVALQAEGVSREDRVGAFLDAALALLGETNSRPRHRAAPGRGPHA